MALQLEVHPTRERVADEIHARPHPEVAAPHTISHMAFLTGEATADAERRHLADLCTACEAAPPPADAMHYDMQLGSFRLRWERHTEFSTWTVLAAPGDQAPFARTALDHLPQDWLRGLEGSLIAATNVHIEAVGAPEHETDHLRELFGGRSVLASRVMGGAATVWTDLRLSGDGFERYLIRPLDLTPARLGRLLQRLLELDTYRLMALLALPVARSLAPQVSEMERALATFTGRIGDTPDIAGQRELLDELLALATRAERIAAEHSYRFGAARAYGQLVDDRLRELRETRVPGFQPIGEFLERRFEPALRTCQSVEQRQGALSARIGRAADLLRTRVNVALEAQNQKLLTSMERRAALQLRLQETVEGLSVVAISYYGIGLLLYFLKGAKALGIGPAPEITTAVAIPLVIAGVWYAVRKVRKALAARV